MRVPYRKPGKYSNIVPDPHITVQKKAELEANLSRLKAKHPHAAKEVQRLAELGDFSENAEYQLAKGRLRGINRRILEIEDHLKRAIVIQPSGKDSVEIGNTVTVRIDSEEKQYTILGSSEVEPKKGIISYQSPVGSALMGKTVNEAFTIVIAGKERSCMIIDIE